MEKNLSAVRAGPCSAPGPGPKDAGPARAQEHFQKGLCVTWEQGRFLKQKGKIINKESRDWTSQASWLTDAFHALGCSQPAATMSCFPLRSVRDLPSLLVTSTASTLV